MCSALSCSISGDCDLDPSREGSTTKRPIVRSSQSVPAEIEQIPDDTVYRQESLRLSRRLELTHLAFLLPGRLMRGLCSVVRIASRVVDHGRHGASVRSAIAPELVGDQPSRFALLPFQHLTEESPGGLGIAMSLNQDVDHIALSQPTNSSRNRLKILCGALGTGLSSDLANFSPSYIQTPPARYKEKSLLPRHKSSRYNEIRLDTKRAQASLLT